MRACGNSFAVAREKPSAKPFADASTPLPPIAMTDSNEARGKGRAPEPANAPRMGAEITVPLCRATWSMSKAITRRAAMPAAAWTACGSPIASPGFSFSDTA